MKVSLILGILCCLGLFSMVSAADDSSLEFGKGPLPPWLTVQKFHPLPSNKILAAAENAYVQKQTQHEHEIEKQLQSQNTEPACSAWRLNEQTSDHRLSNREQVNKTQDFFNQCEQTYNHLVSRSKVADSIHLVAARFQIERSPHIFDGVFKLHNGLTRRALIALKGDKIKRPLVIAIAGFRGGHSGIGAMALTIQLFENSPFDVIVLENNSSTDYILNNKRIDLGGFEDGQQIREIIHLLDQGDSPLKGLVSSYHILGVSLGGHTALYAGLYESYDDQLQGPKLQSVIGVCPVVNLRESVVALQRDDYWGRHYRHGIWAQISAAKPFIQLADGLRGDKFKEPSVHEISKFLDLALEESIRERYFTSNVSFLPPFQGVGIHTLQDFWAVNRFENYAGKMKIPTLVWYSEDDPVAVPGVNAASLQKAIKDLKDVGIYVLRVPRGAHCGVSLSYGFEITGVVLRNFILKNSPEFTQSLGQSQSVAKTNAR